MDEQAKAAGFHELADNLARVVKALTAYGSQFEVLLESRKRLGLNAQDGFRGVLTKSAMMLERWIDESGDDLLMVNFLTMRRYEWNIC